MSTSSPLGQPCTLAAGITSRQVGERRKVPGSLSFRSCLNGRCLLSALFFSPYKEIAVWLTGS